jgi:hypothetical protein
VFDMILGFLQVVQMFLFVFRHYILPLMKGIFHLFLFFCQVVSFYISDLFVFFLKVDTLLIHALNGGFFKIVEIGLKSDLSFSM